ncbi:glycosyl hydrolase [bacterium]|nr:MAG: glycosyl hydrolase [bacterium]
MNKNIMLLAGGLLAASVLPACAQAQQKVGNIQWPVRLSSAAPAGAELAVQAPAARAILDGWQAQNPVKGDRFLRIVYWTPGDREPAPLYRERLSKIMIDIQAFYAREMERNGFGPRTFKMKKDADGMLEMFVARGDKTRDKYSGDTGDEIRRDSIAALKKAGIDGDKETFLIFCNLTDWDAEKRSATGSSPYYASGTTRKGTAWQSDSPVLSIDGLTDVSEANKVHSGQYGFITLGHYSSIFIGGIAHELGHALSMPHDLERPDQAGWGKSLMGSGNRTYGEELRGDANTESKGHGSFLPFSEALRLASHPSFSGSIKGIDGEPNANLSEVKYSTDGKTITYSAKVTANPAVYGVIAYMDPTGGQDYDATTATAIPDKDGRFSINCNALVKGKSGTLRIVTLQANGAASSAAAGRGTSPEYPYNVSAEGVVDLDAWNAQQQLMPLETAVLSRNRAAVEAMIKSLEAQKAAANILEMARVQLANFDAKVGPAPADATGNTLYLSEAKPSSASVGWLRPTYNRLPVGEDEANSPLLNAAGKYYARGIYAHAPAKHTYNLGGKWGRLTGTGGAAQGKGATVVFVVTGDGKELWRSKMVREGEALPFDVDVKGVNTLELSVEDGGNGVGSDWGLWLDPTLAR